MQAVQYIQAEYLLVDFVCSDKHYSIWPTVTETEFESYLKKTKIHRTECTMHQNA